MLCIDWKEVRELPDVFAEIDCVLADLFAYLEKICFEALSLMSSPLQRQWVLNYTPETDSKLLDLLNTEAEHLAEQLPEAVRVTFCCSESCREMKDLRKKLNEASDVKWSRFLQKEPFLLYGQENIWLPAIDELYQLLEKQLMDACSTLNLDLFQKGLDHLFSLPDQIVGHSRTRGLIRRVEAYMFDINQDLIASFANVEYTSRQIEATLQQASSLEDYKCEYTKQMLELFRRIIAAVKSQSTKPVYLAQLYVRDHLSRSIRLTDVAEHVGLNSAYLSTLFKKEIGIGLPNYINQCRIAEAKRLLETTDLKIVSIAKMVGFPDPRYFSRVFRKEAGCRPKDYRTARQRTWQQTAH